jgi:hypothetical protein
MWLHNHITSAQQVDIGFSCPSHAARHPCPVPSIQTHEFVRRRFHRPHPCTTPALHATPDPEGPIRPAGRAQVARCGSPNSCLLFRRGTYRHAIDGAHGCGISFSIPGVHSHLSTGRSAVQNARFRFPLPHGINISVAALPPSIKKLHETSAVFSTALRLAVGRIRILQR